MVQPDRLENLYLLIKSFVNPESGIWIGKLGELSAFLKDIYKFGYLKEGLNPLTLEQQKAIAKTTFGRDLTNMVKKPKGSPLQPKKEKFS